MRATADHLFRVAPLRVRGIPATDVLVETLLDRGTDRDVVEAGRDRQVGGRASRQRGGYPRNMTAAAACSVGGGSRRCRGFCPLPGSLPRHGENAWLRGAYRLAEGML